MSTTDHKSTLIDESKEEKIAAAKQKLKQFKR